MQKTFQPIDSKVNKSNTQWTLQLGKVTTKALQHVDTTATELCSTWDYYQWALSLQNITTHGHCRYRKLHHIDITTD